MSYDRYHRHRSPVRSWLVIGLAYAVIIALTVRAWPVWLILGVTFVVVTLVKRHRARGADIVKE